MPDHEETSEDPLQVIHDTLVCDNREFVIKAKKRPSVERSQHGKGSREASTLPKF